MRFLALMRDLSSIHIDNCLLGFISFIKNISGEGMLGRCWEGVGRVDINSRLMDKFVLDDLLPALSFLPRPSGQMTCLTFQKDLSDAVVFFEYSRCDVLRVLFLVR